MNIEDINFPYKDDFQFKLEEPLNKIYNNYEKEFDENIPNLIKKNFNLSKETFFPLIEYVIKDGEVSIKNEKNVENYYKEIKDDRYLHNYRMIVKTIDWCKKNNLPIPNTTLYIWISDRFPWYIGNLNKFPIFVYARPTDVILPIFPDNTFECFQIDKKYSGECYDWDRTKNMIEKKCNGIKTENKKDIIYFKGTPTTKRTYKLREYLEKYQKTLKIPVKVLLDAWNVYEPIYKFCEYLYLLNLPGHYPWSNRLKYLFLMNSVVINVNVNTIGLKLVNNKFIKEYEDPPYITIIDYVVNKNDYIEVLYTYYRVSSDYKDNKNLVDKIDKKQKDEFDKFVEKLDKVYYELVRNPEKYRKMAKETTQKVKKLTNDRIYQYIYKGILLNSKYL